MVGGPVLLRLSESNDRFDASGILRLELASNIPPFALISNPERRGGERPADEGLDFFFSISLHDADGLISGDAETLGLLDELWLVTDDAISGKWSTSVIEGGGFTRAWYERTPRMDDAGEIIKGLVLNPASNGSGRKGGVTCTLLLIDDGSERKSTDEDQFERGGEGAGVGYRPVDQEGASRAT